MKNIIVPINICVECGSKENIVMHHIIPESKGGKFMIPVCQSCHDTIHDCRVRKISLSDLSKAGIERARSRGVKIGGPNSKEAVKLALKVMVEKSKIKNHGLSIKMLQIMKEKSLCKLQDIADEMNRQEIYTNRGCKFTPTHIHRLIKISKFIDI